MRHVFLGEERKKKKKKKKKKKRRRRRVMERKKNKKKKKDLIPYVAVYDPSLKKKSLAGGVLTVALLRFASRYGQR